MRGINRFDSMINLLTSTCAGTRLLPQRLKCGVRSGNHLQTPAIINPEANLRQFCAQHKMSERGLVSTHGNGLGPRAIQGDHPWQSLLWYETSQRLCTGLRWVVMRQSQ